VSTAASLLRAGRFEIVRALGAGGMGSVYEAFDPERNDRVALKRLHLTNPDALLGFKEEFREFQDMAHPNLVAVRELFCEDGEWYLSMELVEGVNFLRWVRGLPGPDVQSSTITWDMRPPKRAQSPIPRAGHCDESKLRAGLVQIAHGLDALHDAGKVHRDIKPSNVLVTPQGRVVLLDFGLATTLRRGEYRSEVDVVGTVGYMAPEQAAAQQVGPPADWYSVGVMMYEALTGRLPLTGAALDVLMQKQRRDGFAPRDVESSVPSDLNDLCRDLLRFQPSARPNGRAVRRRLGSQSESPSFPSAGSLTSTTFVGRERELTILREAYERSRDGAEVVAIVGESGVGKSSLARRFTELLVARDTSAVVLGGSCYERESVPFKGVDGVVDALSRYLRRAPKTEAAATLPRRAGLLSHVFPVLRRVEAVAEAPRGDVSHLDPQELRQRLFEAVRDLFGRLADRHPLVLVIDDLQWADADSLALLAELVRPPDAPALLLVATLRSDVESGGLEAALPGMNRMPLGRLPPAAARELATTLIHRAQAPSWLKPQRIAQESDGHPLFIDELIRHGVAAGESAARPLTLEEALWARIEQLDAGSRGILELACLASGRLMQQTAAEASGIDLGELAKRIALLRVARLVRTTGMRGSDLIEPYHGRTRAAVLCHLSPEEARTLHQRLALAIETTGVSDPEALALHWREAGDLDKALHYARVAADKAARALAFDRAVRFYQMCLELQPRAGDDPRNDLRIKLADALANAGRGGDAGRMYLEAAATVPAGEALDLRRRAAEQLLRSGHVDEGLSAIRDVLAAVGKELPRTPRAALASLLLNRARVRMRGLTFRERDPSTLSQKTLSLIDICSAVSAGLGVVDTIRGADFQARQLLLALEAGEPSRVLRALAMETAFVSTGGTRTERRARRLLDRARELASRRDEPTGQGLTNWAAGTAAFLAGRWREASDHFAEAEEVFQERCTGVAWELDTTRFFSLWVRFYLGDLSQLAKRVPALGRESEARGDLYAATNLNTMFRPFMDIVAGRPDLARADVEDALTRWSRQGFHVQHVNGFCSLASADLYDSDPERAVARFDEMWSDAERSQLLRVQQIRIRTVHLRACAHLACGRIGPVEHAIRALDREHAGWATALAQLLRAGVIERSGDRPTAAAAYRRAIELLTAADMALYVAAARLALARNLDGAESDEAAVSGTGWLISGGVVEPERLASVLVP